MDTVGEASGQVTWSRLGRCDVHFHQLETPKTSNPVASQSTQQGSMALRGFCCTERVILWHLFVQLWRHFCSSIVNLTNPSMGGGLPNRHVCICKSWCFVEMGSWNYLWLMKIIETNRNNNSPPKNSCYRTTQLCLDPTKTEITRAQNFQVNHESNWKQLIINPQIFKWTMKLETTNHQSIYKVFHSWFF